MKYALIGCGRIAVNHIKAVVENNIDMVAACDIKLEKIDQLVEKTKYNKDFKKYSDYKKMIDENLDLDFVSIATESGIHAEIALYCIENGINVIIEKPMAMSMEDANKIINLSKEKNVKELDISDLKVIAGMGVQAVYNGEEILIGKRKFIEEKLGKLELNIENELLTIFISIGNEFAGFVVLEDEISDNAFEIIKKLKEKNIDVYMITGDSEVVARKVASKLGIENVLYEVMPNEKSQKVLELQKQGKIVAMVGDGINDAPALASADISFAMGTGTDIAMETSDITLMNGNLNTLLNSINISEQTLKIINKIYSGLFSIILLQFLLLHSDT